MKKKLILVASPPACGKTYVSELIAKSVGHIVYLDKDDLCDLLRASFAISDQALDMDGDFYINHLRSAEYSAILNIAFSALRFEDHVILNAPFGKEVRDVVYMKTLKDRANKNDAKSHFTVRSRTKKPAKSKVEEIDIDIDDIDINIDEPTNEETNNDEQSLDSYVYGDVQVFGDEDKADEDKN